MNVILPVLAYVGPETILPVTSALAAVAGFCLMMGRSTFGFLLRLFRPFTRKRRPVHQEDQETPDRLKTDETVWTAAE